MGRENDISSKIFLSLKKYKDADTGKGSELKVMAWVINGKERPPIVVRQEFWMNDKGQEMNGKVKGLAAEDLWIVIEKLPEVCSIMKIPAHKLTEALSQLVGPTTQAEKEPF